MNKLFLTFLSIILISTLGFAELKLKLTSDLEANNKASFGNHQLETNLQLVLPASVTNPSGNDFLKMWLVGALVDVAFPMGDFGDAAGTGFSFHAMAGYMIAKSILLNLTIGYQSFGSKSETEGYDYSSSWVPFLVGVNYVFNPGQKFMPFVGLGMGLYFLSTTVTTPSYSIPGFGEYGGGDISATSTEFGIVPRAGFYYLISPTTLLSVGLDYNLIFTSGSSSSALAILVGVLFALK